MAPPLLIQPLDLSQFDQTPPAAGPGFTDLVNSELAGIADDTDGFDALVTDGLSLIDSLDAATATADADLIAILALLDAAVLDQADQHLNDYTSTIPTGEALLGDSGNVPVPALGKLAITEPSGQATIVLGGPPSEGGVATAGTAPYTLYFKLFPVGATTSNVGADAASGPNPPFTSFGAVIQKTLSDGITYWVYQVQVNPVSAGAFNATLGYHFDTTIAGFTGTFHLVRIFQLIVAPGAPPPPPSGQPIASIIIGAQSIFSGEAIVTLAGPNSAKFVYLQKVTITGSANPAFDTATGVVSVIGDALHLAVSSASYASTKVGKGDTAPGGSIQ